MPQSRAKRRVRCVAYHLRRAGSEECRRFRRPSVMPRPSLLRLRIALASCQIGRGVRADGCCSWGRVLCRNRPTSSSGTAGPGSPCSDAKTSRTPNRRIDSNGLLFRGGGSTWAPNRFATLPGKQSDGPSLSGTARIASRTRRTIRVSGRIWIAPHATKAAAAHLRRRVLTQGCGVPHQFALNQASDGQRISNFQWSRAPLRMVDGDRPLVVGPGRHGVVDRQVRIRGRRARGRHRPTVAE